MTEREIIERVAEMAHASWMTDELRNLIDSARALVKPEPDYSSWIGGAVEVRAEGAEWVRVILVDYIAGDDKPFKACNISWRYCRPISEPLKLIFTPHDPRVDAKPVPDDEWVLAKRRDGEILLRQAGGVYWGESHHSGEEHYEVIGFMRIKP